MTQVSPFDSLSPGFWHARFLQQVRWTAEVRAYLARRLHFSAMRRILEVGSGTGAVISSIGQAPQPVLHGLDLQFSFLQLARYKVPALRLACGNALVLPYANQVFDITLCHFLLLWLSDPLLALREMCRVTRSGGFVVALAEPDYGGRIDFPTPLVELGKKQAVALRDQGADPDMGRKLAGLFRYAGLQSVQVGLLGSQWSQPLSREAWESEWSVIETDLMAMMTPEELAALRQLDWQAWQSGERVLFVPTFYAWGQVKF